MTDKKDIDWAEVKAFFDRAIYRSPELKVLVTMDDREMEVHIPPDHVRKFMENLSTYRAVVLPISEIYTIALRLRASGPSD